MFSFPALSAASTVTLSWTPPEDPDVIAFRVYMADSEGQWHYRTDYLAEVPKGSGPVDIDLGDVAGQVFYFTVTSLDTNGIESEPSEEIEASLATGSGSDSGSASGGSGGCFIRTL